MQIKLGNNVVSLQTKRVIEIGSRSLWSLYSFCTYFTHVLRSYQQSMQAMPFVSSNLRVIYAHFINRDQLIIPQ